jgi:hypothetical protein
MGPHKPLYAPRGALSDGLVCDIHWGGLMLLFIDRAHHSSRATIAVGDMQ